MSKDSRKGKHSEQNLDSTQESGLEQTDVLPPTTVVDGKYCLGRLIGEGGMGAVYEAEHTGLGINVAVKLLNESFTSDYKALSRFQREARATAAIRHPNIVEVRDTGTDDDGVPFIVMELLQGESLSALLRREKVLPTPGAVTIASQMLSGLAAAHSKGVIHRDLKPGNILLAQMEDGSHQVKILDFGISKFFSSAVPQDVTAAGAVIGTPRFMAPEQAIGQPDLDSRVDLYAVGVLLYRMLTGRLPYNARTNEGVIQQILQGQPPLPRNVRPSITRELEAVILKAMDPNREKRWQNAQDFIQALQEAAPDATGTLQFTNSGGIISNPSSVPITSPSALSGASTIPSVAYTPGDSQSQLTGPPGLASMVPAPTHPGRRWLMLALLALVAAGSGFGWYLWSARVTPKPGVAEPLPGGTSQEPLPGPAIRFGISRFLPRQQLIMEHQGLLRYLSRRIQHRVKLEIYEDYVDLAAKLRTKKLDLAALSAYGYVRAKKRWPELDLLATHVTKSGTSYEGFVVAMANANIRSLEDLKDKRFCYVSPTSTSGYLYPRALFRRKGMDPDTHFKTSRFTGDHLSALKALQSGACDGAAVFTGIFFEARKHGITPEKFTVLATTDRIPYDAYCVVPGLSPDLSRSLKKALLALKPDSEITRKVLGKNTRIVGFAPVKDSDYNSVRQIEKHMDTPPPPKSSAK